MFLILLGIVEGGSLEYMIGWKIGPPPLTLLFRSFINMYKSVDTRASVNLNQSTSTYTNHMDGKKMDGDEGRKRKELCAQYPVSRWVLMRLATHTIRIVPCDFV